MAMIEETHEAVYEVPRPIPTGYRIVSPTGRPEDGMSGGCWTLTGPNGHQCWFHSRGRALRYARWHRALCLVSERIVARE